MNNIELLQQCCRQIEEKLGWGNSDSWQNQDFEALSTRIFDHTQVALSVSTLKRVWGRVKYDNFPSLTTLNTLAIFAGYEHWRDFRQQQMADPAPVVTPAASVNGNGHKAPATRRRNPVWVVAPGVLVVLVIAGWMYNRTGKGGAAAAAGPDSTLFSFSSQPVSSGIPNSVIFNYDATAAKTDSVFIQQSWDPRRRFAVAAKGHTYTSIYYYPGFFKAKLVVGNKIVKEHSLFIPSDGWLAAVAQDPVPVYFTKAEFMNDGALRIPVELMERKNIHMQPQAPEVRYYNMRDLPGLMNDNFIFETTLKSEYNQGTTVCQRADIMIHCEGTIINIPLGIPGCVGEMALFAIDSAFNAQHADLSAFGCNMSEWVKVRCEARNKQLQFWVNGKKAYSHTFSTPPGRIVGVSYRFQGAGAVDAVKLTRHDGNVAMEDTFD